MAADLPTGWTWLQFNAAVDSLCPLECKRLFGSMNIDGSSVYYRKTIRQAVLDLANFIPEFTRNNETIYYNQDFAADGSASVGVMPPMAELQSGWYYNVYDQVRYPVVQVPWEGRFQLTTNATLDTLNSDYVSLTASGNSAIAVANTISMLKSAGRQKAGIMAISPKHDQFYLFPAVDGAWVFSMFWDGQKLDYRDAELVPFEEEAAQAVAWWVQAQFASYIERDIQRAAAFHLQYSNKRSNIYTRTKSKGFV